MFWAKCTLLVIYVCVLLIEIATHGTPKKGNNDARIGVPVILILLALLYAAGALPTIIVTGE